MTKNKTKTEYNYAVEVDLKFTEYLTATSKEEAREAVKNVFKEQYNIELVDSEIKKIERE